MKNKFADSFSAIEFPNLGYIKIPKYKITEDEVKKYTLAADVQSKAFLFEIIDFHFKEKIEKGLIPRAKEQIYAERIKLEFETFVTLQFTDYILLIYDIIKFCKKEGILNSPSRGSCGGSLVLYILDVIGIDPIEYDLLFERFISASRTEVKEIDGENYIASSSLPDVDIDSDRVYKPLINKYLEERFPKKTCRILNLSTLSSKVLIKECGKVILNKDEEEMKAVSKNIESLFGKNESITDAYAKSKEFKAWCDKYPVAFSVALKLQNLIKNKSVHASGIFVSNDELNECIPTEITKDKEVVTSFSMDDCQLLGIKIDNLGLKNLGTIDKCLKSVNKKMSGLDINDPSIYKYLTNSRDYYGIFQCEEGIGKEVLMKIKPRSLYDVSVAIALSRPGCMKFIDDYIYNRDNGVDINPRLKDILGKTYGIIIFQEQIMQLCARMAKFAPQKTDGVRKAVGKKLVDKMKTYKEEFISNSIENGFTKNFVEQTWQTFEDSGNYLFNLSHATGYAFLTCISALLKSNHPIEYFKELLVASKDEQEPTEEISKIHQEFPNFGIKLLRPHIIKSELDFKIEDGDIRFGLLSIKGISIKSIEKLTKFRNSYSTKLGIFKGAEEASLPMGILCALIQAGTLDTFGQKRTRLVLEAQLWNILTDKEKKQATIIAEEHDNDLIKIVKALSEKKDEKGKPIIKESRLGTLRKKFEGYQGIYNQNRVNEPFTNWYYERKLMGYSPELMLKNIFIDKNKDLLTTREIMDGDDNDRIALVGFVKEAMSGVSRKKTKYYKMIVGDETGSMTVFLFDTEKSNKIDKCRLDNNGKLPKEDNIVVIRGVRKGDAIFADEVIIESQKIYTKLGDLKNKDEEEEKELTKVETAVIM